MVRDLWGNLLEHHASYFVFHDESIPNKRWFIIGLVFVREDKLNQALKCLSYCRHNQKYYHEIHFSELPKSFAGEYGAKARVARCWLRAYEQSLADIARFTALAVDRHSPAFDHKRFAKEYHAYNRFTAMALKAGISWFLGKDNLDSVTITFVSDAKDRMSQPDKGWVDNFEEYLPYRAELDAFLKQMQEKNYPFVTLQVTPQDSANSDLLQLCDILLGATQTALIAGSTRATKLELGRMIVHWCNDLSLPPRQQRLGLHRKFNLWAFPDENGRPYNRVGLSLTAHNGQLKLF